MSPFALVDDFSQAKPTLRADFQPGKPFVLDGSRFQALQSSSAERAPQLDYRAELVRSLQTIAGPLARVELLLADSLRSKHAAVQPLLDHVTGLGGKRLRPALLLLTTQSYGHVTDEAIRLAVVVELVHTATLVHDDILDVATTRRHQPTLHCKWDVERAILVGDWLFTQAYSLANAGDSTVPGRWVADAAKAVCEGEIQQDEAAGRGDVSESAYFQMLAGKTGALCAISCGLGAWAAGADLKNCERMYDFGMKLGIAFQIHDDWLDIWGDAEKTGKPVGGDLQGGKWTLPLLRFRDTATDEENQRLRQLLSGEQNSACVVKIKRLLDSSDASEYTRSMASRMIAEAIESIADLPASPQRDALQRLATAAVQRTC